MVLDVREALAPLISRGGNARAGTSCLLRANAIGQRMGTLKGSQQAGAGVVEKLIYVYANSNFVSEPRSRGNLKVCYMR